MRRHNLINGARPQFGNPEHIAFIKTQSAIMSGQKSFYKITWKNCDYIGNRGETSKPSFIYTLRNSDAVVDHIPCPYCNRLHVLLFCALGQLTKSERRKTLIEALKEAFSCWNCKTNFTVDAQNQVFVSPLSQRPPFSA